jgi:dihydrofolate reductase
MSKITLRLNLSLDGVMQAPGRADEDTRGGFQSGGWAAPYFDPMMFTAPAEGKGPRFLFGRRTYEDFYSVWPNRTDNPFTAIFDNALKYVASTTLKEPLPWVNSTLLKGDAADTVAALKQQPGSDLLIFGSGVLDQSLMRRNLIDLYVLLIHPLVLGSGRRLFSDGSPYAALELVDSKTTKTGVVIATYRPAEQAAKTSP